MTEIFNLPLSSPVELVQRYGGPLSHAALDTSHSIFRTSGIHGLIGFLVVQRCTVVFGDPVCAPEHKTALADAFATYCADNSWPILYSTATSAMQAYAREQSYVSRWNSPDC
jgi:lysylphosphatidylglycerol synthetase-like protein (DUF2156 family)